MSSKINNIHRIKKASNIDGRHNGDEYSPHQDNLNIIISTQETKPVNPDLAKAATNAIQLKFRKIPVQQIMRENAERYLNPELNERLNSILNPPPPKAVEKKRKSLERPEYWEEPQYPQYYQEEQASVGGAICGAAIGGMMFGFPGAVLGSWIGSKM